MAQSVSLSSPSAQPLHLNIIRAAKTAAVGGIDSTWTLFEILVVGVVCVLAAWYAQFHWNRRRLYRIASEIKGPTSYPFIGSGLLFLGNPTVIFNNIIYVLSLQRDIVKVWFGTELFYGITSPDYIETVLNSPKSLAKTDLYKYAKPLGGTGLFTAAVPKWKRHRKAIMPTFNQRILDAFVEVFSEKNEILVEQLKRFSGKGEFDLFDVITKCTLDIICETAMGVKVDLQETSKNSIGGWLDEGLKIIFLRMFVIWYHFDFIFNWTRLYRRQEEVVGKFHKFTGDIVREKRLAYEKRQSNDMVEIDEEPKRKAFLDLLIELSSDGAKWSDEEMREEVDTFVVAGSDTTASSICFIFTMLGMHPDIQQKVYDEVIDVLGPDRVPEFADLPQLKYTECVIKETLRLFPVGAFIVRHIDEDLALGGKYTLPAGSSAVLGFLVVHRSAEHWPDPLRFDPDRFLPENSANRHPYAYLPFSGGPRNCIGPKYAMMSMKTMMAMVVRKYQIGTAYRSVEDVKLKTHLVLRPSDGFKVSLKLRD